MAMLPAAKPKTAYTMTVFVVSVFFIVGGALRVSDVSRCFSSSLIPRFSLLSRSATAVYSRAGIAVQNHPRRNPGLRPTSWYDTAAELPSISISLPGLRARPAPHRYFCGHYCRPSVGWSHVRRRRGVHRPDAGCASIVYIPEMSHTRLPSHPLQACWPQPSLLIWRYTSALPPS